MDTRDKREWRPAPTIPTTCESATSSPRVTASTWTNHLLGATSSSCSSSPRNLAGFYKRKLDSTTTDHRLEEQKIAGLQMPLPVVRREVLQEERPAPACMKRTQSDETISRALDGLMTQDRPNKRPMACPKSPVLINTASLLQKKSISPRDAHSPRMNSCHKNQLPHTSSLGALDDGVDATSNVDDNDAAEDEGDGNSLDEDNADDDAQGGTTDINCEAVHPVDSSTPRANNSSLSLRRSKSTEVVRVTSRDDSSVSTSTAGLSLDMDLGNVANTIPTRTSTSLPKRTWQPHRRNRNPGCLSLDLSQMDHTYSSDGFHYHGSNAQGDPQYRSHQHEGGIRVNHASVCSRVTDFLFIGGAGAAKNKEALDKAGITHIVNCAASVTPDYFPNDFLYYNLRLRDHSTQDIARHFYNIFDFIEDARCHGGKIFVHCVKGISRSPTMAIAYLMWYKRIGMYKALDFVRQARPVVDPNAGFIFQLTEWEHLRYEGRIKLKSKTLVFRVDMARNDLMSCPNGNSDHTGNGTDGTDSNASCEVGGDQGATSVIKNGDESQDSNENGNDQALKTSQANTRSNSRLRPLIIGPLSAISEDTFRNPTNDLAKNCFLVVSSEYGFIWCGADVEDMHMEVAHQATKLLQRFESFPEKIEVVSHGREPASFWQIVQILNCPN